MQGLGVFADSSPRGYWVLCASARWLFGRLNRTLNYCVMELADEGPVSLESSCLPAQNTVPSTGWWNGSLWMRHHIHRNKCACRN